VGEQGIWGIRTNHELRDIYKDLDKAAYINLFEPEFYI